MPWPAPCLAVEPAVINPTAQCAKGVCAGQWSGTSLLLLLTKKHNSREGGRGRGGGAYPGAVLLKGFVQCSLTMSMHCVNGYPACLTIAGVFFEDNSTHPPGAPAHQCAVGGPDACSHNVTSGHLGGYNTSKQHVQLQPVAVSLNCPWPSHPHTPLLTSPRKRLQAINCKWRPPLDGLRKPL